MTTKAELFTAYGDDPRAILDAWPNLDPQGYAIWSDKAEERQILTEYRRWARTQTIKLERNPDHEEHPALFPQPRKGKAITVRQTVVHDGEEVALLSLTGHEGATLLRQAMLRDLGPASTTVDRCRYGIKLADLIDAETERLGRPVSAAEILGVERAA